MTRCAEFADELIQSNDVVVGREGPLDIDGESLSRELVDDVEHLHDARVVQFSMRVDSGSA